MAEAVRVARLRAEADKWKPHPGQQTAFFESTAFEALFGGAAGPGKSETLLMLAKEQVWHPKYTAILFRRTFPMLEQADGLIQRSLLRYPAYGGRYNAAKHFWTFPSGARIYFGHMQLEKDMYQYQGAQFTFVGWDELTEFEERMYLYMFTRCRTSAPELCPMIRSATNPGNIGHQWVKKRFITRDIVNQQRYFAQVDSTDTEVEAGGENALSRAFYPAVLADNPSADPNYLQRIRATGDEVMIARYEHGDWDAENKEGRIYDTWTPANISAEAEYNPDLPLYWGVDDGYVYGEGPGHISYHPRVILFMQDNPLGGLNIVDEYTATEETHEASLTAVLGPADGSPPETPTRWQQYKRPSVAYVDGSAAMLRGEISRRGINSVNATHRVTEGIKAVRQMMPVLRVHPRCQNTIYEFGEYRSDPKGRSDVGETVPLKNDDHSMDAARYVIYKRRHQTRGAE